MARVRIEKAVVLAEVTGLKDGPVYSMRRVSVIIGAKVGVPHIFKAGGTYRCVSTIRWNCGDPLIVGEGSTAYEAWRAWTQQYARARYARYAPPRAPAGTLLRSMWGSPFDVGSSR